MLLKFSPMKNNTKLKKIGNWADHYVGYTFSLPSGYSCPGASECKSQADRHTGKIKDGKDMLYRCFSATTESVYKNTRDQRWYNFNLLRSLDYTGMYNLISKSIEALPKKVNLIRIHVGGDFFNQTYYDVWQKVAYEHPHITFYSYTKSINYIFESKQFLCGIRSIPNFKIIASVGGKHDAILEKYSDKRLAIIRSATVVNSIEQAQELGLEIDYDERLAITGNKNFALLLHGTQPKVTVRDPELQLI